MEKQEAAVSWNNFSKIEMRVGTIIQAEVFKEAKKPAYKMIVDFGDFGTRRTSAQISSLYSTDELIGKQVIAVINFPPKQIANLQSQCLVLGAVEGGEVTLLIPDKP